MTDCGCAKAKKDLEEYLHNELLSEDAADIREHLAGCESCTKEHRVGLVLTEVVRRACADRAPEELRAQVLRKIREVQSAHSA